MWTSLISDKKQWISVFGDKYTPKSLNISYAIFKDNSIKLKLYAPIEENKCPEKWLSNEHNKYEFELLFNQVCDVKISNFSFYGPIHIDITNNKNQNDIHIEINNYCKLACTAQSISAINIKAYHNDNSA
ncbi:Immunity protein 50 [Pseudomonas arsenicoxydans]|uniref:Immunity protein 50 n=1 Tax=Pseudomonas arsenicoxydans TaxID=702115 RepID=A0A1H0LLU1_9PSED|nr:Immunity protein 50 [Pseudomonas arsenicoxydans]